MINFKDYEKLNISFSPLFLSLIDKLKKDILVSVMFKGKQLKNFIFNIVLNEENPRITIFIDREGIESFKDLNINGGNDSLISPFEISYVDIELKKKEDLTEAEIFYLEQCKRPLNKKYSLIINYFKRGFIDPSLMPKELEALDEIAEVLGDILEDKEEAKTLEENDMFLLYLNQEEKMYSFSKTDESRFIPNIHYSKPKASPEILEEIKDLRVVDESMNLSLAFTSNFTRTKYPLSLICYSKNNDAFSDVLLVDVTLKDRKKIIWSYLIDKFEKYGLPHELYINDSELYYYLSSTLAAAGVDLRFSRQNAYINSYIDDLQLALFSFNENAEIINRSSTNEFNAFLQIANNLLVDVHKDGYDPVTQKLVDNLQDFYDLVLNYSDSLDDGADDLELDSNNLVS